MSDPELGQMMFGNKWEDHDAPGFVIRSILDLSEALAHAQPDQQSHGFLGGEFGYGGEYVGQVFEMHPYWWGDCECGQEEREAAWCDSNDHSAECYQSALTRAFVSAGFDEHGFTPPGADRRSGERDRIMADACERFGLTYPHGCMVHCTCDYRSTYASWIEVNPHDPKCGVVRPNFLHIASGTAVHWYKYIGRSTTINRQVEAAEWRAIRRDCEREIDSLAGDRGADR